MTDEDARAAWIEYQWHPLGDNADRAPLDASPAAPRLGQRRTVIWCRGAGRTNVPCSTLGRPAGYSSCLNSSPILPVRADIAQR